MLDTEGYKHTLIICNTYCFSTATVIHKCASLLPYMYIACLFKHYLHELEASDSLLLFMWIVLGPCQTDKWLFCCKYFWQNNLAICSIVTWYCRDHVSSCNIYAALSSIFVAKWGQIICLVHHCNPHLSVQCACFTIWSCIFL